MGFWVASPLDTEEPCPRKSLPGRLNTHWEGNDGPDQLKESEGLAVALYVAVQCSEKLDFDIVWAKIKPFTEALCSHDYWLTPYFIKAFRP